MRSRTTQEEVVYKNTSYQFNPSNSRDNNNRANDNTGCRYCCMIIEYMIISIIVFIGLYIGIYIQISIWTGPTDGVIEKDYHRGKQKSSYQVARTENVIPAIYIPNNFDLNYVDASGSFCKAIYNYTCGNFTSEFDKILGTAEVLNKEIVQRMMDSIHKNDLTWCYGLKCKNVMNFYQVCKNTRRNNSLKVEANNDVDEYIKSFRTETREEKSLLVQLAGLITRGYVSPLSIKRDKQYTSNSTFTRNKLLLHVKSSSKFEDMNISPFAKPFFDQLSKCKLTGNFQTDNDPEQLHALGNKMLTNVDELIRWISRGNDQVAKEWIRFFYIIAQWVSETETPPPITKIWIENAFYLRCLSDMLLLHTTQVGMNKWTDIVRVAFEQYIRYSFHVYDDVPCIDITKQFYPITMCRWFMSLQHRSSVDDDEEAAHKYAHFILETTIESIKKELYILGVRDVEDKINVELIFGSCWGILDNKGSEENVFTTEQLLQVPTTNLFRSINTHFYKKSKWSSSYHPIELHFMQPSVLGEFNDALDWFSQVNAYYQPYHNCIVFSQGILRAPIFTPLFDIASNMQLSFIIGHEWTHKTQASFDKKCVIKSYGNDRVHLDENLADVFGFRIAFRTYKTLIEMNLPQVIRGAANDCDFFKVYSQMWCSAESKDFDPEDTDPHASPIDRIEGPFRMMTPEMNIAFEKCFGCKPPLLATCELKLYE